MSNLQIKSYAEWAKFGFPFVVHCTNLAGQTFARCLQETPNRQASASLDCPFLILYSTGSLESLHSQMMTRLARMLMM